MKLMEPYKAHINFGVWLDSEASGGTSVFNKLNAINRTICGQAFLAAVTAAGYKADIYASDNCSVRS